MADITEKKFLGTEGVQQLIANTRSEIAEAEQAAKDYADGLADNYDAAGTAATKVQELADGQVKTNKEAIGTMDNLETTNKGDLVSALNEVRNAVSAGGTAAAITMSEQTTGLGEGILKAYTIKQGENTVGTINIPKDMVVQSGEVVVNPDGQAAGTYIKLVLANATNDVIYVNVGTLVDIYTAKASAAQVQLAIDSAKREISASIVAGSITVTELAADAVTTVKIADGNVTKAKLSTEVQASLEKADAAAQDATDKAAQALKDAKEYADSKVEGVDLSGIATNAGEITKIKTSLAEGGATANAIKAAHQAGTDAATAVTTLGNTRVKALEDSLAEGGDTAKAIAAAHKAGTDAAAAVTTLENGKVKALEDSLAEGGATANAIKAAHQAGTDAATAVTTLGNTRVKALEDSLAEGGDTYKAISAAKQAGIDAASTLETGKVATLEGKVEALESVSYVEITATEIDNMFDTVFGGTGSGGAGN